MLGFEELEEIGRKLKVFHFGRLQELVTLFEVLKREKISLEKLKDFIDTTLSRHQFQETEYRAMIEFRERKWNKNSRRCPTCMTPMRLSPIKEPKGKANVYGYTCLWYCPSEKCNFEEYSKEKFEELYQKIMGGR